MPELAEVKFYANQWVPCLGQRVERVRCQEGKRVFRRCDFPALSGLDSEILQSMQTHGKQMLFGFSGGLWLHLHLGMAGRLQRGPRETTPSKHDHLILYTNEAALVYNDSRMFGEIRCYRSVDGEPPFWKRLPPEVTTPAFTREFLGNVLRRHARAPLKAILLRQEFFPGVGNWMADEILWRSGIHPACPGGRVRGVKLSELHRRVREVAEDALRVIATDWGDPPDDWLFPHRWRDGGVCPRTGRPLCREVIGGRTTCYSPARQRWPEELAGTPPLPSV
ncbi:MAG: Fpg/Nei family DNA glycosylase [Opitutales bacterium]|nr:Fpg/Nei family DNA glycosylase [Opitutales bacterium]